MGVSLEEKQAHLRKIQVPYERWDRFLAIMDKYDTNPWWESKDPLIIARFQMHEKLLLVPSDFLQFCLRKTLNRPVTRDEMRNKREELQKEVDAALAVMA